MERSHILIVGAAAIIIVVILTVALYFYFVNGTSTSIFEIRSTTQQATPDNSDDTDSTGEYIAIQGFDRLIFRANRTKQSVNLYNPAKNKCYFQIKIVLPDGREIYNSDMIAPNESIGKINLNTTLPKGTHENSALIYTCYSIDTLKIINGATIKFTLEVK